MVIKNGRKMKIQIDRYVRNLNLKFFQTCLFLTSKQLEINNDFLKIPF